MWSGAEIVTRSEAVAATPDGSVAFADGSRAAADLVVAADGTGSRLRDGLGLVAKRKALADGAIRLLIPKTADEAPDDGTTIEYWSGSRRILYTPCSRSEVYIALTMLDRDAVAKVTPIQKAAWKRVVSASGRAD